MRCTLPILLAFLVVAPAAAQTRDGVSFDPGRQMTSRATGAPEELDAAAVLVGSWDVVVTRPKPEGEPIEAKGKAEIVFMNRGHALKGTFYSADVDGHELASMAFLGYNPASALWFLAGADSYSERAWIADGSLEDGSWVFVDTRRLNGGLGRTDFRYSLEPESNDAFRLEVSTSGDEGASWNTVERRVYTRRRSSEEESDSSAGYGSPDPNRSPEAAGFDFLVGEWNNTHDLTFPNGQRAQWVSNATAVFALNGAAILEYSWFDVDPSLPDAATTILRIYNRAMRRWESLYVANRGHSILYFGGTQEGDEIVLTNFETDMAGASIPRYVFHSMAEDSYSWYSESSTDHGRTWRKTWLIDAERKKRPKPGAD